MNDLTCKTIEAARASRASCLIYNTDTEIIDLADEVDRLTRRLAKEKAVTGPSTAALIGHHLTEAIKHLSAAAELACELTREDASALATSLAHMVEAVRDARGDVEGPKP